MSSGKKPPVRKPGTGRPTQTKQARVDDVCERVAEGQTIREIAAAYGVTAGTVMKWVTATESHTLQYARAREAASDLFEADIIHRAKNIEDAAAARVEIDALKWVAARRSPKKYGDRVNHVSDDRSMTPAPALDVGKLSDAAIKELAIALGSAERK